MRGPNNNSVPDRMTHDQYNTWLSDVMYNRAAETSQRGTRYKDIQIVHSVMWRQTIVQCETHA